MLHLDPTLRRAGNWIPRNECYGCHARPNQTGSTLQVRQNRRTNALEANLYV